MCSCQTWIENVLFEFASSEFSTKQFQKFLWLLLRHNGFKSVNDGPYTFSPGNISVLFDAKILIFISRIQSLSEQQVTHISRGKYFLYGATCCKTLFCGFLNCLLPRNES